MDKSVILFLVLGIIRFADCLLDLTLVIPTPIAAYNEEAQLKCVAKNSYFRVNSFPFKAELDVGTGTNLTHMRRYGRIEPEKWPGRQIVFMDKAGPFKYGVFSCAVNDNATGEEAKAIGVIMSKNALLFPTTLSTRADINESVIIKTIQVRPKPVADVFWVHLGAEGQSPRIVSQRTLQVNLPNAQHKDKGVYVVFHHTRDRIRRVFQQATARVVVPRCEKGKYGQNCTLDCPACENGGVCDDVSGSCICPPGFRGNLCEIGCGYNLFGLDCQHNCTNLGNPEDGCKGKMFCLIDPYGCSCATGFYGIICTIPCGADKFGAGCELTCHCQQNDSCDPFTGTCHSGCGKGWTGGNCQVPCANGTHGLNCVESCGNCHGQELCDRFTGHCPPVSVDSEWSDDVTLNATSSNDSVTCQVGFLPPLCHEQCDAGTWGSDCANLCHCRAGTGCDVISGRCPSSDVTCDDGWRGVTCNVTCQEGRWGANCESRCGACVNGSSCEPKSGSCVLLPGEKVGGCEKGLAPPLCVDPCDSGSFGLNCSTPCNCANGSAACEPVSGSCEGYCQPGWIGDDCWDPCPYGTYGLNCSHECGNCFPLEGAPLCNPVQGHCEQGCMRSWTGRFCEDGTLCRQDPCMNWGTCEQTGDMYLCHCRDGYSGAHCEILSPACDSSPCQNNATCAGNSVNITEFECKCAGNFTGKLCEEEVVYEEPTTDAPEETTVKEEKPSESSGDWMNIALPFIAVVLLLTAMLFAVLYKSKKSQKMELGDAPPPTNIRPKSADASQPQLWKQNVLEEASANIDPAGEPSCDVDEGDSELRNHQLSPVPISVPDESDLPPPEAPQSEAKQDEQPPQPSEPGERSFFGRPSTAARKESIAHVTALHLSEPQVDARDADSDYDVTSDAMTPNERASKIDRDLEVTTPMFKETPEKRPEPPKAPGDLDGKYLTLTRASGERSVSRPSAAKVRLTSKMLGRLSEISLHNFYASPGRNSVAPEKGPGEPPSPRDNRFSASSIGGCALDAWDSNSKRRESCADTPVYGVTRRDSALLVRSSRSVEEEFEMESRRGGRASQVAVGQPTLKT